MIGSMLSEVEREVEQLERAVSEHRASSLASNHASEQAPASPQQAPSVSMSFLCDVVPVGVVGFLDAEDFCALRRTSRALFVSLGSPMVWRTLVNTIFRIPTDELDAYARQERTVLQRSLGGTESGRMSTIGAESARATPMPVVDVTPVRHQRSMTSHSRSPPRDWQGSSATPPPRWPNRQAITPTPPRTEAMPRVTGTPFREGVEEIMSRSQSSPVSPKVCTSQTAGGNSFPTMHNGSDDACMIHNGSMTTIGHASSSCAHCSALEETSSHDGNCSVDEDFEGVADSTLRGTDVDVHEFAITPTPPTYRVCRSTVSHALQSCPSYPWERLFRLLYRQRVTNWLQKLRLHRAEAIAAGFKHDFTGAISTLDKLVQWQLDGGLQGGIRCLCKTLATDLILRGQLHEKTGSNKKALGDYSLALIVDPYNLEATAFATELATSEDRCSAAATIKSPSFDFDFQYDALATDGTLIDRATFLFEMRYWRGHSFASLMQQYLLGDPIQLRSSQCLFTAKRLAQEEHQRLLCDAWLSFDDGDVDRAVELAELALSLLPLSNGKSTHSAASDVPSTGQVQATERIALCEMRVATQFELSESILTVLNRHGVTCNRPVLPLASEEDASDPRVLSTHPDSGFCHFTLAFVSRKQPEVSMAAYFQHLRTSPLPYRRSVACNNIASQMLNKGEPQEALRWLLEAMLVNPCFSVAYKNAARALMKMDNRAAAFAVITHATKTCKLSLSDVYAERSKYSFAVFSDLALAQELNPRMSHPYRLRAALLMDREQREAAVDEITMITDLSLDPSDVSLRALFHRDCGNLRSALIDMALAIALAPKSKELHRRMQDLVELIKSGSGDPNDFVSDGEDLLPEEEDAADALLMLKTCGSTFGALHAAVGAEVPLLSAVGAASLATPATPFSAGGSRSQSITSSAPIANPPRSLFNYWDDQARRASFPGLGENPAGAWHGFEVTQIASADTSLGYSSPDRPNSPPSNMSFSSKYHGAVLAQTPPTRE